MLNLNNVPVQSEGFIARELGDEMMIISENKNELHTLDQTGSFIWKNMDGEKTISSIIDLVCKQYDVKRSKAKTDILEFINKLIKRNIVLIKNV